MRGPETKTHAGRNRGFLEETGRATQSRGHGRTNRAHSLPATFPTLSRSRCQGFGAACSVSFFMTSSMYGRSLREAYSPGKQVVVRSALVFDQALMVTAQRSPFARR